MDCASYHSMCCFVYSAPSCAFSNLLREKVSGDEMKKITQNLMKIGKVACD